jgi:hypothetical protein
LSIEAVTIAGHGARRNGWYPPASNYDYTMPMGEVLRLAACFQSEELCD